MSRLLRKMQFGLRTQGLSYLYRAPLNEFSHPRLPATRMLRKAVVGITDRLRPGPHPRQDNGAGLCFVYDLAVAPITFDFISYLAGAELARRRAGCDRIDVLFVAGDHLGVRREQPEYEAAVDAGERLWRVRNILIPALSLLPTVRSHAWCPRSRAAQLAPVDATALYPPDYRFHLPCQPVKSVVHERVRAGEPLWPLLRATDAAKRHVARFLSKQAAGRRPIVVSLRDYRFAPSRNSRTLDWVKFADRLDRTRYAPIFVPDTEMAMASVPGDFGGHPICLAACWNLEIRMALYEAAWLNMGLMHGPLELCWFNDAARYLIFLASGSDVMNSEDLLREHGHRIGADLDFATPFQHIAWQPDTLGNIEAAFEAFAPTLPDSFPVEV